MKDVYTESLVLHKKLRGKIELKTKKALTSRKDLSLLYTPGIAQPCREIAKKPSVVYDYTWKSNTIAIISDGSAVLGLGNIGAEASLPVLEGKSLLFKELANINCIPIALSTQKSDEIITIIKNIMPSFGAICLEDIAAPRCFQIEEKLQGLSIPVVHDDQHGTAIVVLAGMINALKVVGKRITTAKFVILGAGAAGTATAKLLRVAGAKNIVVLDSKGIVDGNRPEPHKRELAKFNAKKVRGGLREALTGADVLLGVSGPNLVKAADVKLMAKKAIVFAMANPTPEIMPDEAKRGGAMVVGTGRSDFPNQINNSLAFPGVFRGALDHRVTKITDEMKVKAAKAIAALVKKPTANKIIPDMFDKRAPIAVAKVIR